MKFYFRKISAAATCFFIALTLLLFVSRASAQSAPEPPGRWLFIFSTSSAMKQNLPATALEIKNILYSGLNQQLNPGDTIGIWTFGETLHAGQLPLIPWVPAAAATTASNLVAFVREQTYSGNVSFDVLQNSLYNVIDDSPRLTVLIFCDGASDLHFMPYADDINQTLHQTLSAQQKAKQPYVLAVRTQLGRFVGVTLNLPPGTLDLPPFPPMPAPAPVNVPVPAPVIAPPVVVPPLIIVGTNVGTNLDELKKFSVPKK
jgi:hypothetical protein